MEQESGGSTEDEAAQPASIRRLADGVVTKFGPISGLRSFGFDRDSLAWMDGFVSRIREHPKLSEAEKEAQRAMMADWPRNSTGWRRGPSWTSSPAGGAAP